MLESVILTSLGVYLSFFIVNYAELFTGVRQWVSPRLHPKVAYALACPVCYAFWGLSAVSLFTGFTPLVVCVPPVCLFLDLAFHKLKDGCK